MLLTYPEIPESGMTRRQKIFYFVFWLDCELQNGGIGQFTGNHGGDYYLETIDALLAIGAMRSAAWLTHVQDALGFTLSRNHDERHAQLAGMDISELDRIGDAAAERVRSQYGDWEVEEDELKLLAFVREGSL